MIDNQNVVPKETKYAVGEVDTTSNGYHTSLHRI